MADIQDLMRAFEDFWMFCCRGGFRGSALQISVDRHVVAGLLPNEIELIEQDVAAAPNHPVIVLLGKQEEVHFEDDLDLIEWLHLDYKEAVVIVPYVQWKDKNYQYKGPFAYLPVLYLSREIPIGLGELAAYNKKLAKITMKGFSEYRIDGICGSGNLLKAKFESDGAQWRKPRKYADFDIMKKMLKLPVVGHYSILSSLNLYACTHLVFDFKRAKIRPVRASMQIQPGFCSGLEGCYIPPNCPDKPFQAVQGKNLRWRLNPPLLPEFFNLACRDDWCAYKPHRCPPSCASFLSRSLNAGFELLAGAANGLARGAEGVRDCVGPRPAGRRAQPTAFTSGVLESGARAIDEIAQGVRAASDQLAGARGSTAGRHSTQHALKTALARRGRRSYSLRPSGRRRISQDPELLSIIHSTIDRWKRENLRKR